MTDIEQASRAFMHTAERLPTLYSLSSEFERLVDLLEDPDADPTEVDAELQRVAGDIKRKAYGVAVVIRQLEGLAELQKSESQRLAAKAKAAQGHADRLRDYARQCMHQIGEERLETGSFTLAIRTNPPSVVVLDATAVPTDYQRTKVIVDVDKRAILEHTKQTGEVVPGTEIVRGTRLDIR